MTVDLGAGDGHYVLARAAACPHELVLGVDASHAAMADASRRASRSPRRGGLPNARFVVSGVQALPCELDGIADLGTVHFPWGTLLAGALGRGSAVTERIAALVAPGGRLRLLISSSPRDPAYGAVTFAPDVLAAAYRGSGLAVVEARPASLVDVDEARSSWGRRLMAGRPQDRLVWHVELARG